jgi:hypothetical protein
MQSRHDGAGGLTTSFTLGNVPAANWATATALTASMDRSLKKWRRCFGAGQG